MRKKILISAIFLSITSTAFPADITEQEIANNMLTMYSSEKYLDEQMDKYGLSGEKRQIVKDYTKWILTRPEFVNRAAKIMKQVGGNNLKSMSKNAYQTGLAIGYSLLDELVSKGTSKVPVSDQRIIYKYQIKLLEAASPQYCKKLLLGPKDNKFLMETIPTNRIMYKKLSVSEVREMTRALKKSVEAALNDNISEKIVHPTELEIANKAFENIWIENCKKLSKSKCEKLIETATNQNGASDEELCQAGIFTVKSIYSLDDLLFTALITNSVQN